MLTSDLLKSQTWKRLPPFIRNADVFSRIKRIEKPFGEIGLKNCIEALPEPFEGKKSYIGFSSMNIGGLWDIATMSMRGVCSCMHWDNMHAVHLVGSVVDPFLGIVYITDNELTPYGISFRRRSLVRFLYSKQTKSYSLLLERVYKDTGNKIPTVYNNRDEKAVEVTKIFKKFLTDRVSSKHTVITERELRTAPFNIPRPSSLTWLRHDQISMSDCAARYDENNDDAFVQKFAAQN
jgi:hypothetical protein